MIPGMAQHRKELEMFDEREVHGTEAIIRLMTPEERRNPRSSTTDRRRARIAYGSGVSVSAVNALLQRFEQASKMMKRMTNRAGHGRRHGRRIRRIWRARRLEERQERQERQEGRQVRQPDEARGRGEGIAAPSSPGKSNPGGSAFAKKPQANELPAGLQDMLGGADVPSNLGGGLSGLLG